MGQFILNAQYPAVFLCWTLLKPSTCLLPGMLGSEEMLDTFYLLAWLLLLLELNNFILTFQNLGQPTCSLNKRGLFNAEHCSILTKYLVCNYTFMTLIIRLLCPSPRTVPNTE